MVVERTKNPGFPFWVAGIEHTVGQRPPTPPLDMLTAGLASTLKRSGDPLWSQIEPAQADGWDGGLPRNALEGYAAGGETTSVESPTDFSKVIHKAKPVYFPEEGTDVEKVAMAFHAQKYHDTYLPDGTPALAAANAGFRTNGGGGPVVGAPFHNPCIDDKGQVLHAGYLGEFFSGEDLSNPMSVRGRSVFNSDTPRIYKGSFLQFDAVLNKVGYHYPQQRIVALWQDVGPVINKAKAARAARHAVRHLRLRRLPQLQPRAGNVRDGRLPGPDADRHHRAAHPPPEVGPDHHGRRGERLELRGRHPLPGRGPGADPRDQRLQRRFGPRSRPCGGDRRHLRGSDRSGR